MAVANINLYTPSDGTRNGILLWEDKDSKDIQLEWYTEQGTDTQSSFTISLRETHIIKGANAESAWSGKITSYIPATKCSPTKVGNYWRWRVSLSTLKATSKWTGGSWDYSDRKYDALHLEATIYSRFTDNYKKRTGQGYSNVETNSNLYIGYLAKYTITDIYYDRSDLIVIEYDAPTWTRTNDRFAIESTESFVWNSPTSKSRMMNTSKGYWSTVAGKGRIEIPTSILAKPIMGKWVALKIYFNPSYRPSTGVERPYADTSKLTYEGDNSVYNGYIRVGNHTIANIATIEWDRSHEKDDPYSVYLKVGDSGTTGNDDNSNVPLTHVTVSYESEDNVVQSITVPVNTSARMYAAPLNTPTVFYAIGEARTSSGTKVSARPAYTTAQTIHSISAVFDSKDGTKRAVVTANKEYTISTTTEVETVKFAGRERPCAFYGKGGNKTIDFKGVLLEIDADKDARTVESMPFWGDTYMRFTDGRVYLATLETSHDWSYSDTSKVRQVSITGTEVDA